MHLCNVRFYWHCLIWSDYLDITLRDYQLEAVEQILENYKKCVERQLIVLPTGSGKTIIMAELAKRMGKRTLLLAHREELISQAILKFKLVWPDVDCGICMADQNEYERFVVMGSVQSCYREERLALLKNQNFELLLIDEAHHASASSYQMIIEALGFSASSASKKLMVGVTATPMRSDAKELGNIFDKQVYNVPIGSMMQQGYLSPVTGRRILTKTSLKGVHTKSGDFAVGELSEVINTPERNQLVASSYLKYAKDRKGVVFCCDVQHCKDLAEAFQQTEITAKAIYGDMDSLERKDTLTGLKNGQIQVVTSCGVLTEGFDEPTVNCIAMARPTKFKGLYIQCIGRGLRIHPSKADCLVLDFSDEGHNLETIASLSKTIPEARYIDSKPKEHLEEADKRQHSLQITRECDEEFNILGSARFIWIPIGDGEWSLADDEGNEIVLCPQGDGYIARLFWKNGRSQQSVLVTTPIPIEYCSGACEDFARKHFKLNFASLDSPWINTRADATPKQITQLIKMGITPDEFSKPQAFMKIKEAIALEKKRVRLYGQEPATPKQISFLNRQGLWKETMTKSEATHAISMFVNKDRALNRRKRGKFSKRSYR